MSDPAHIVIVDDEVRMCESLEKLLGAEGYRISAFVDSEAALTAIESVAGFDCVLTDIKMPGADGIQVLERARARDPLAPVILMTGYASLESAVEAVNRGAYDYLLKPIEFPQLKIAIERGLAQRRSEQERLELMARLTRQNRLLRDRQKELRTLHRVGVSVSTSRPLAEVLDQLLRGATRVTEAEQGSLMLLNEVGSELSIRAAIGLPEEIVRTARLKTSEGISGHVARTGEAVRVANVADDPRFARTPHPRYESRSFLSVPLKISDRVLGVLNVSSKGGGGEFRARDLRLLTIFATQAAALIEDARLFEDHRRQLEEQRVLYHIAREVASAERFSHVASAIYDSLGLILPLDFGLWLGWNEVRHLLHYRLVLGSGHRESDWSDFELSVDPSVRADDATLTEQVQAQVTARPAWQADLNLLLVLPIRLEERLRGALVLGSRRCAGLNTHQMQIAAIAGSQAAAVYERHLGALDTTRLTTMGNMISEIAHDLKKPLTNLKGSLQVLQQQQPQLTRDNPFFLSAEQEIHHLNELIRELVEFSNPVRYPLDRVTLSVPLERALSLIQSEATRRRIEVATVLTPQSLVIRGQDSEIVQALLNVLHNGLDSMDAGGVLTVRTSVGTPGSEGERFAAISIRDTGCGIPSSERNRIFTRHYTTKESGSGLGLAIVERILQAHNGFIEVNSGPEEGTEFVLYFPLAH